eukprot:Nk52_evm62s343 gene=Nk52_evmTU62s343
MAAVEGEVCSGNGGVRSGSPTGSNNFKGWKTVNTLLVVLLSLGMLISLCEGGEVESSSYGSGGVYIKKGQHLNHAFPAASYEIVGNDCKFGEQNNLQLLSKECTVNRGDISSGKDLAQLIFTEMKGYLCNGHDRYIPCREQKGRFKTNLGAVIDVKVYGKAKLVYVTTPPNGGSTCTGSIQAVHLYSDTYLTVHMIEPPVGQSMAKFNFRIFDFTDAVDDGTGRVTVLPSKMENITDFVSVNVNLSNPECSISNGQYRGYQQCMPGMGCYLGGEDQKSECIGTSALHNPGAFERNYCICASGFTGSYPNCDEPSTETSFSTPTASSSASSTSSGSNGSDSGMNWWLIVTIVISCIFGALVIGGLVFFCVRRRRNKLMVDKMLCSNTTSSEDSLCQRRGHTEVLDTLTYDNADIDNSFSKLSPTDVIKGDSEKLQTLDLTRYENPLEDRKELKVGREASKSQADCDSDNYLNLSVSEKSDENCSCTSCGGVFKASTHKYELYGPPSPTGEGSSNDHAYETYIEQDVQSETWASDTNHKYEVYGQADYELLYSKSCPE